VDLKLPPPEGLSRTQLALADKLEAIVRDLRDTGPGSIMIRATALRVELQVIGDDGDTLDGRNNTAVFLRRVLLGDRPPLADDHRTGAVVHAYALLVVPE